MVGVYAQYVIAGLPMYVFLTAHHATFLFCSLRMLYLKDKYNFLQLLAAILPLLIIPFRAATTWCASTGDGYCVDPTLTPHTNATNPILDINEACITASSIQWIIASLAYMANAMLVLEYLVLSKYVCCYTQLCALVPFTVQEVYCSFPCRKLGVYVRILKGIVMEDILKFSVIFIVALYIFVGSFYLALRAAVMVNMSTGAITSDLEVFELQTL